VLPGPSTQDAAWPRGDHLGEASVAAKTIPRHARALAPQRAVPRPDAGRLPGPTVSNTGQPQLADGWAGADPLAGPIAITEHAVLGDAIRRPIAWCEMPCCISRHEHPAALGEADIRARALATGWCHDAVGRLVCPSCQQRNPDLWVALRLVRQDRAPAWGTRQGSGHARAGRLSGVRAAVSAWARAIAGGQDRPSWSHLLATPVSVGNGGSTAPPIPARGGDDQRHNQGPRRIPPAHRTSPQRHRR
jgi:hypothetical protein